MCQLPHAVTDFLRRRRVGTAAWGAALLLAVLPAHGLEFEDVAAARGLQEPDTVTRATAWEDLDRDGDLDVVFANLFYPNRIYRNDGDGVFTDVSETWGIDPSLVENAYGVVTADYDRDGDADFFFTNGGFNSREVNRLYRNDLDTHGGFTEVAAQAGVQGAPAQNHAATWFDYDGDGWVDLFVHRRNAPSALYRNNGDGTFLDVAPELGVNVPFGGNGACAADFDEDGDLDLFLPAFLHDPGPPESRLYRNDGIRFTDVTRVAGIVEPRRAFSCAVEDFNQDGVLDLYVVTYNQSDSPIEEPSVLYLGHGNGSFEKQIAGTGADLGSNAMGLQSGDLDNDGRPEIFVGRGDPLSTNIDVLLSNQTVIGSRQLVFEDVSVDSGIREVPATRTHGTTFVDFDRDGDVDLFNGMGGNMPIWAPGELEGQEEPNRFWVNVTESETAWLRYRLTGVESNTDGIGARLTFWTDAETFYRHVSGGNGFNTAAPYEQVAGFGTATSVRMALVRWPSGIAQAIRAPQLGVDHDWIETGVIAPAVAVAGQSVRIDLVGRPDVSFQLFSSSSRVPSPVPAGRVLLGQPALLQGSGTFDADGRAVVDVALPIDLGDGERLFWQARVLDGPGPLFTNVPSTVVQAP